MFSSSAFVVLLLISFTLCTSGFFGFGKNKENEKEKEKDLDASLKVQAGLEHLYKTYGGEDDIGSILKDLEDPEIMAEVNCEMQTIIR